MTIYEAMITVLSFALVLALLLSRVYSRLCDRYDNICKRYNTLSNDQSDMIDDLIGQNITLQERCDELEIRYEEMVSTFGELPEEEEES